MKLNIPYNSKLKNLLNKVEGIELVTKEEKMSVVDLVEHLVLLKKLFQLQWEKIELKTILIQMHKL